MTISFIQSDAAHGEAVHTVTATFPGATTAGNALLAVCETSASFPQSRHMVAPAGWTTLYDVIADNMAVTVAHKVASGSETTVAFTCDDDTAGTGIVAERTTLTIMEIHGEYEDFAANRTSGGTSKTIPSLTPDSGVEALFAAVGIKGNAHAINAHPGGYAKVEEVVSDDGSSERLSAYWKHVDTTSGSYSATITYAGSADRWAGIHAWFSAIVAAPVADFEADHTAIIEGETVEFTDLSLNSPTSWVWDFGDGGTSTSQNPSHVYSVAGPYTVSLTATNAQGSDTETKTFYINVTINVGFEEPPPDGVLLEIYAAAPGSARWDHANWDEALWSTAGWQDVTPEGITVDITWGSRQPERGILSRPEAADWRVQFYDPERKLDPANVDSPFFGDIEPGLPIRASHRGTVIRQGQATGIQHSYADVFQNGFIRATDNVSVLANAKVPPDVELADTLWARAVDAIAAAGLTVRVVDPVGTDPAVAGWETGVNDWSAWQWIMDAAEQVNYIPVITNTNDLTFRPWATPLARGRAINSPNLVDLQVIADYQGQYSVVTALDDDGVTIEERALTPPPRYGARTYSRTDETIDAAGWSERVLADRALPMLRWVPGDVYPLTADDVQNYATLQAVEQVSIAATEQSPPVSATVIVVGGRLHVEGKRNSEATWLFGFEAAQTATEPLIETGGDPTDYLLATGGDQFLYPST